MYVLLTGSPHSGATLTPLDAEGAPAGPARTVSPGDLAAVCAEYEATHAPRWVWSDATQWYPQLLRAGVTLARCVDLRLGHAVLAHSPAVPAGAFFVAADSPWPRTDPALEPDVPEDLVTLFDAVDRRGDFEPAEVFSEFSRQRAALAAAVAADPIAGSRLRLLLAAESGGALIAAEIYARGLPWSAAEHDRILTRELGPRPRFGGRPERLEELAVVIRAELDAPTLNPDSPQEVLRALNRAGIAVASTSKWLLKDIKHPVIEPLLRYKSLSRLLTANGWTWLDTWVRDGRYRPEYVVAGTATGRWATSAGGAMQLPAQIRAAVRSDPGWTLVVADAAQLEPRIIAGMSRDEAMAAAGAGKDLYQGLVDAGVVPTRAQAKLAMLGALYGATGGESGALMPRLRRAFPRSIELVESAARAGERGRSVSTWLGRASPVPEPEWFEFQRRAGQVDGSEAERRRAGTLARDWGRFSRNFIAQGTAAEWALCWMAGLRTRLAAMDPDPVARPHLVYFLHDEVVVHAPVRRAAEVAAAIEEAASEAGRLLFGRFPLDFPLSVAIVERYDEAK